MEKDWTLVYTVNQQYQAQIVQELLDEEGITAVIMNKKDTSFTTSGDYEVYVRNEDAEKAKKKLEDSEI